MRIEAKELKPAPFPKLMIHYSGEDIILATEQNGDNLKGIMLTTDFGEIAEISDRWAAQNYRDYHGLIILTQP